VREEELHAFIDGRLDPSRQVEVAKQIAADPALRARVEAWSRQAVALRDALSGFSRIPAPPGLNTVTLMEQRLARREPSWRMAASVALIFALGAAAGAGGGWAMREPARPTEIARLQIEAASAYRVFAADTTRPIEIGPEDRDTLVRWMAQKLGRRVSVPDLSSQGYRLLGGRVLTAMYGPAAMLLYEDTTGGRITVYVQPMSIGREAAMERVQGRAVDGFAWIAGRIGYSVLAGQGEDGEALHGIANQVRNEMQL
jgi:anti-sigma factor RsiW